MPYVITQALLSLTCRLMKLFITPDDMVFLFYVLYDRLIKRKGYSAMKKYSL